MILKKNNRNSKIFVDEETALDLVNKGADLYIEDKRTGKSWLHWAVYRQQVKLVHLLVEKGADVMAKDRMQDTPLHLMSLSSVAYQKETKNIVDIMSFLISRGANVNVKNSVDETPLHRASRAGYLRVASLFLEKGADVNAKNISGQTPLHLYIFHGNLEMVRLLIKYGADTQAKDVWGYTPFYWTKLSDQMHFFNLKKENF